MDTAPLSERTAEGVMDSAVKMLLQQSLRAALDRDLAYDTAPYLAVVHARMVFEYAVASFLGSQRSIIRLPTELVVEALSYLDTKDQITASYVSRRWRSISLATPRLWSFISSYSVQTRIFGALPRLLERSQDAPLTLELIANNDNAPEIALCLTNHLHHVKHLSLHVKPGLFATVEGQLSLALETPAPILQTFNLRDSQTAHDDPLGPVWFDGSAPLLSRVRLHIRPGLLNGNAAFLRTRRLFISPVSLDVPHAITSIMDLFPLLDTLAFSVDSASTFTTLIPAGTLGRLSRLRELAVIVRSRGVSIVPMLPWLSQLSTPRITVSWQRPSGRRDSVSEAIAAMTANLAHVEWLSIHYSEGLNLDFRGADGTERTFLEVPHALRPSAAVFAQLTSLALSELAWTQGDVLPPAPALTNLRIFLLRPYSHRPSTDGTDAASVFLLRERRALACPALRRVAFVARCFNECDPSDEPTVVAPRLLREFVQNQFAYDAPLLDTLALVGVQLLQRPVDDVVALFGMARDVEIDPHAPSDLRPAYDVVSWDWP